MPATSGKQQRFMGAELGRLRAGKPTKTGMSASQLEDFAMSRKMPKSHMPKGASQSPKGDLGVRRQDEARAVGGFKSGKTMTTAGKFGRMK